MCTHKISPRICISWLVVMVTEKPAVLEKKAASLLPWQPSLRMENHYSSTQFQNIKLMELPSFKPNQLLYLQIKCHKRSFPQWLLRSFGVAIAVKVCKSDQN